MKKILLSFDIEEFDMPTEYGKEISLDEQIAISAKGTEQILDALLVRKISATFFSTFVFAENAQHLIRRIITEGHELASHSYFHSEFETRHLLESRLALEKLSGVKVVGFRMPRMKPVTHKALLQAGYHYNSSLNPTYLPGRYNNLSLPRVPHVSEGLIQVPASVTPRFRIPLFWLAFHNFPLRLYLKLCEQTLRTDSHLNIYFHPWEFMDLSYPGYGMPSYVKRNAGEAMGRRFDALLNWANLHGCYFQTISDFIPSLLFK